MFQSLPNLPYENQYLIIHLGLFLLSVIIATGVSFLVYKFIELPSHVLSTSVGKKISQE